MMLNAAIDILIKIIIEDNLVIKKNRYGFNGSITLDAHEAFTMYSFPSILRYSDVSFPTFL